MSSWLVTWGEGAGPCVPRDLAVQSGSSGVAGGLASADNVRPEGLYPRHGTPWGAGGSSHDGSGDLRRRERDCGADETNATTKRWLRAEARASVAAAERLGL
eukprot:3018781-Rhodomonas_salina.4